MAGDSPQTDVDVQDGLPVGPIPGMKYPIEVTYCGGKFLYLIYLY